METVSKLPRDFQDYRLGAVLIRLDDPEREESYLITLKDFKDHETAPASPETKMTNYLTIREAPEIQSFLNHGLKPIMAAPIEAHFECNGIEYLKL